MQDRGYVQDSCRQANRQLRKTNGREKAQKAQKEYKEISYDFAVPFESRLAFHRFSLSWSSLLCLLRLLRLFSFSREIDLPNGWPRVQVHRNAGVAGYCHLPQSIGATNFG
jgi:hypothetical protein